MKINAFFKNRLQAPLYNHVWSWGAIDETSKRVVLRTNEEHIFTDKQGDWALVYDPDWNASPDYVIIPVSLNVGPYCLTNFWDRPGVGRRCKQRNGGHSLNSCSLPDDEWASSSRAMDFRQRRVAANDLT